MHFIDSVTSHRHFVCSVVWAFMFLLTACGNRLDCRHKTRECASGFSCTQISDTWSCTPTPLEPEMKAAPSGEVRESAETVVPTTPKAKQFARAKHKKVEPCPSHKRCTDSALLCVCNEKKQLVEQRFDRDSDGKEEERAFYQYNQNDLLTFVIVDLESDGDDDLRHEYAYRSAGMPMFWKITNAPGSSSDTPDLQVTYQYNEKQELIAELLDKKIDTSIDEICEYVIPCAPPIPNENCEKKCRILKNDDPRSRKAHPIL